MKVISLFLFFNLDQFLRLDVFQEFHDLRNIAVISLARKFEDLVNIFRILSESTSVLVLIFHIDLNMQFLVVLFVIFTLNIFCLGKFANFE